MVKKTHNERLLLAEKIKTRVDIAKTASYETFSGIKSSNDFYLDNLLNTFIALVQYPVSFAVLENNKTIFHFCHDKEHYVSFTKFVESAEWNDNNSFLLFPLCLDNYRISVIYMNSKRFNKKETFKIIENYGKKNSKPSDRFEYIGICAKQFFEDKWSGFESMFRLQARKSLQKSIDKLSVTYSPKGERIWPKPASDIINYKKQKGIFHPNYEVGTWNDKVDELLTGFINDIRNGLRVFTGLNHIKRTDNVIEFYWQSIQPPNIFLSYRNYSRLRDDKGNIKLRHVTKKGWNNRNSGYAHNVNFVVPNRTIDFEGNINDIDPYSSYFMFMRASFSENWYELYEKERSGRLLYQNIFIPFINESNKLSKAWRSKVKEFAKIAKWADEIFWNLLVDDDGINKILEIMRSAAGDYARSMADPVFSTGLIHINPAYELGGLDRIDEKKILNKNSFEEIDEQSQQDIIRIVALYYYFSGSAAWAGDMPLAKDPRKLCVMLLPMKMRGAVWGVTAHALYLEDYERSFEYDTAWLSNFLLATSGRRQFNAKIDGVLWGAAQRRIMRLIEEYISQATSPEEFVKAIHIINAKIRGEQLLTPYALPKFELDTAEDDSAGHFKRESDGRTVWYVGQRTGTDPTDEKDKYIRLSWTIEESAFFSARQPWSQLGTRTFLTTVQLGLKRGLEKMVFE